MRRLALGLALLAACARPAAPGQGASGRAAPPAPSSPAGARERVCAPRAERPRAPASGGAPEEILEEALGLVESGGDRASLEKARVLALRGAEAARAPALAGRLLLVAAMAENDLGRPRQALALADRALRHRPGDPDVRYERGVALYELCRFGEAERELARTAAVVPGDAWALHQLGLVAERRGDFRRAEALLARAAEIAPDEFARLAPPPADEFGREVRRQLAALPEEERALLAGVPVSTADLPDLADLVADEPPLSPAILGLFRGPPLGEACLPEDGDPCRAIVLYRKNLARLVRDRAELAEQIRRTLHHEIGHLRGLDDDQLREAGLE